MRFHKILTIYSAFKRGKLVEFLQNASESIKFTNINFDCNFLISQVTNYINNVKFLTSLMYQLRYFISNVAR